MMGLSTAISKVRRKSWSKKNALSSEPQWSQYQKAIFDWVENGSGNLQIGAVAGSGKSTVIAAIVSRLPADAKIHILAFNKHIVESMKGVNSEGIPRLPSRVKISTAHSMGKHLITTELGLIPRIDGGKYRKIARSFIASLDVDPFVPSEDNLFERNCRFKLSAKFSLGIDADLDQLLDQLTESELDECHKDAVSERKRLIAAIRRLWMTFALDLVRGCHSTLCNPNPDRLNDLINYYGIEIPVGGNTVIPLISGILESGDEMARNDHLIDFGDMLWIPHKWRLQPSSKDWVLIDEVQDANRAQLSLYEKLGRNGRVIVVGDEDQAIQGFAFSSPKMWTEIGDRFNAQKLPLSVCYRCPTSHLDLARYFVPTIQPAPNAKTGEITVIDPGMVNRSVELGDLILCRFTAPLIKTCVVLIVRGIPAKVRGRDIASDLASYADIGESSWAKFPDAISLAMNDKINKLRDSDESDRIDSLKDSLECLLTMYQHFGRECGTLKDFMDRIESLFSDDNDSPVTLSTIHRSKGDEADRVFILMSNVLPYYRDGMQEWQVKQEENLAYVALTRSRQSLFLVPMGRDEHDTKAYLRDKYGGMNVESMPSGECESAAITPHKIGDRFIFLNCGPHEITAVIANGNSWEYAAEYKGDSFMLHWHCETYPHSLVKIINTLDN